MGIRFKCHQCGHDLHVKDFQAGKRSKCPNCSIRFRIPNESAATSIAVADGLSVDDTATAEPAVATATKATAAVAAKNAVSTDTPQLGNPKAVVRATGHSTPTTATSVQSAHAPVPPPTAGDAKPRALSEAPESNWFVQPPTGGQYGPATSDIFEQWLAEHRVTRDSLVWREGWEQWQPAGEVFPEYFSTTSAPSLAIPPDPASQTAGSNRAAPKNAASEVATVGTASPSAGSVSLVNGASASTTTLDRARLAKKMKRKRNYTVMISILAVISIGLVIALIVVLSR